MGDEELDRQLQKLRDLGYPDLAGLTESRFEELVEPLRALVPAGSATDSGPGGEAIPFLVVVTSRLVATVEAVGRWSVGGKRGWTDMADELSAYRPIQGVEVPDAPAYLLLDVDTGRDTLNTPPDGALPAITARGRTPLTIDEGVALVTMYPDVFETRNAFQALGSRAPDKRIPSFWVSKGAPRLGWCWAGNPHSWLGAGSAAARRGPVTRQV